MELVVVSWGMRVTLVAAAAVTVISLLSGAAIIDAADRGAAVALAFTLFARWVLDRLETPEQRLLRLRAQRQKRRRASGREGSDEPSSGGARRARSRTA